MLSVKVGLIDLSGLTDLAFPYFSSGVFAVFVKMGRKMVFCITSTKIHTYVETVLTLNVGFHKNVMKYDKRRVHSNQTNLDLALNVLSWF